MKHRNTFAVSLSILALLACGEDTENNTTTTSGSGGEAGMSGSGASGASTSSTGGTGGTSSTGGSGGTGTGGAGGSMATIDAPNLQLAIGCESVTHATLTWIDNSVDEDGFRIERSEVGANAFSWIASVPADATSFTDTTNDGGSVEYRVVAYNADAEAESNVVTAHLALPEQTAKLEIDPANNNITIVEQPSHFTISTPATATWAGAGNPMTVSLTVENSGADRLVFNLKASVVSVNDSGMVTGDGLFQALQYVYFGPEAVDVAASATRDIVIDNLTGAAGTIEVELRLTHHPMLMGNGSYSNSHIHLTDAGGTGDKGFVSIDGLGNGALGGSNGTGESINFSAMSPDGRTVYFGNRNQPTLIVLDTVTMSVMTAQDLTGQNNLKFDSSGTGSAGSVRGVTLSPDAKYLYVTLATQTATYEAGSSSSIADNLDGTLEVIRLERETLTEVDRVVLMTNVGGVHVGRVVLTPDGTRGIVRVRQYQSSDSLVPDETHGRFFVLDMATMSIVDGDPASGDQQAPFDMSAHGYRLSGVTLLPAGDKAWVVSSTATNDSTLYEVDLATAAATVVDPPTVTVSKTRELLTGPDGRIYWGTNEGMFVYDLAATSWVEDTSIGFIQAFSFQPASCSYYRLTTSPSQQVTQHLLESDERIPNADDGAMLIPPGTLRQGHAFIATPF